MMVLCCGTTTGLILVAARYGQAWMIVAYSGYILALSVLLLGGTAEQRTKNDAGFYTGIASLLPILLLPRLAYPENPVDDKSALVTVTQMWTETGINNPQAVFQNYLILMGYIWLCLIAMIVLPFPRTARSVYTTVIIPTALDDILHYNFPVVRDDDAAARTTKDMEAQDREHDEENAGAPPDPQMVHWAFALRGKAGVTKYEPRLWKHEDLVTPLATLLADVATVARISLLRYSAEVPGVLMEEDRQQQQQQHPSRRRCRAHSSTEQHIQQQQNLQRMPLITEMCRDALRNNNTNNTTVLEKLRTLPHTLTWFETRMEECRNEHQSSNANTIDDETKKEAASRRTNTDTRNLDMVADNETLHSYGTRFFLEKVECVKQSTILYLDCLNGTTQLTMSSKEMVQNRIEFNFMWMVEPLLLIVTRLYQFLILVAHGPAHWDWRTSVQSLQFAFGIVLLFAVTIYLPNFAGFGVDEEEQDIFTSAKHQGWMMLGYALVWRPTVEGTIKKGLMRIVGTLLGGFCGWAGTIVCAGISFAASEDKDTFATMAMNPYGTVIWTTFFNVVAAYFTTDAGPSGCFGQNYSFGYVGTYFILVQSIVMLEAYSHPVTRNAVVVTRVVATLVGVILAIIVQVVPPNVFGRFPRDIIPCLQDMQTVFQNSVDAALSLHPHYHDRHSLSNDGNDSNHSDVDDDDDGSGNASAEECSVSYSSSKLYESLIVSGYQRDRIETVDKLLNHWLFLAKDAGALSFLPLMQLHPQIIPLLEDMAITLDYIRRQERIIAGLKQNPQRVTLVEELYDLQQLERPNYTTRFCSSIVNNMTTATNDDSGRRMKPESVNTTDRAEMKNVLDGTSLFPAVTKLIEKRLKDHENTCQEIIQDHAKIPTHS